MGKLLEALTLNSGINVGQTEEAEDLYLYADASHTQIFRPNRRGAPPCGPFGRASRGSPPSFALRCIPTPAPMT